MAVTSKPISTDSHRVTRLRFSPVRTEPLSLNGARASRLNPASAWTIVTQRAQPVPTPQDTSPLTAATVTDTPSSRSTRREVSHLVSIMPFCSI